MDMLFKLYRLPSLEASLRRSEASGIGIRRAMAYERGRVIQWVEQTFGHLWSSECAVAFARQPIGCHIAVQSQALCGFCCIESTYRNFLGPVGVEKQARGKGVGGALVLFALNELRHCGYAYAVVGDVGEPQFFKHVAGAVEIPGSSPGAYPEKLLQGNRRRNDL